MKEESRFCIILHAVYLVLNRFIQISDLISGCLLGLSLLFLVMGLMPEKSYLKIKQLKKSVIN